MCVHVRVHSHAHRSRSPRSQVRLVKAGFWRDPMGNATDVVYECHHGAAVCLGVTEEEAGTYDQVDWQELAARIEGVDDTAPSRRRLAASVNLTYRPFACSEGAYGPLCALCKPGWVRNGKDGCRACPGTEVQGGMVLFLLAMGALVTTCSAKSMISVDTADWMEEADESIDIDSLACWPDAKCQSEIGPRGR